jgi:hypothetical protein
MPPHLTSGSSLDAPDLALGQLASAVAQLAAILEADPAHRRLSRSLLRLGKAPGSSFRLAQAEASLNPRTSHLSTCASQLAELGRWLSQISTAYHTPVAAAAATCLSHQREILSQLLPLLAAFEERPPSRRPAA